MDAMPSALWYVLTGALLCAMALAATLIRRLPLSTALVYLPIGWLLGPHGLGAFQLNLAHDARLLEEISGVVILISLFSAGLKMRLALNDRLWLLAIRLAFLSMMLTVLIVAGAAVWFLHFPWGLALLVGGILAPTDPVLASEVQIESPYHFGALRFGLTSEAGFNDGTAFPFVLLGLALLQEPFSSGLAWRWLLQNVLWGILGGIAIGYGLTWGIGKYVLHLRSRHQQAVGLGYFLAPGLIAICYGTGELIHAYGFLAVFVSGVTLRRLEAGGADSGDVPQLPMLPVDRSQRLKVATDSKTAPVYLVELLLRFTDQLEQMGELVVVVIVGAMLTKAAFTAVIVCGVLVLFVLVRPISVFMGLAGGGVPLKEKALFSWFGIRGIGSLYYLAYALDHGLEHARVPDITNFVFVAIALSITLHGISVTPLMNRFGREKSAG